MLRRATFLLGLAGILCGIPWFEPAANADPSTEKPAVRKADTDSKAKPPSSSKDAVGPTRKRRPALPPYFGQLGVNDQQRLQMQNVQSSYEARLKKLREELKSLVVERDQKLENLLTDGQKLRLHELQEAARQKAAQRKLSKQE